MDILVLGAAPVRPVDTPVQTSTLGLQLAEGQLIKAMVQRTAESFVWLNVNGRTLAARTEIPLRSGQELSLQVAEIKDERITLRPLIQSDAASLSLTMGTQGGLESLLTGWGLDVDDMNLAIAQALLAGRGSVSQFDVQAMRALWHRLSVSDQGARSPLADATLDGSALADIRAMAYLYTNRLPIGRETLALARNWLEGPPQLAGNLAEMENALVEAIALLRSVSIHSPAARNLLGILEQAAQHAAQWPVPLDASATVVARRLAASLAAGSIPQDTVLSDELDLSGLLRQAAAGKSGLSHADVESLLQSGGDPAGRHADPGSWLQRLSAALDAYLGQPDVDGRVSQALHRLQSQTDRVSADLATVQMVNSGHSTDLGAESALLLPIPMVTPDGPSTAYIKVYRRAGQHSTDPRNLRMALLFSLPELGEITINLSVSEQRLNGQILSDRQHTHDLVLEKLSELRSDLGRLGYHVEGLTCGTLIRLANRPAGTSTSTGEALHVGSVATNQVNLTA